MTRLKTNALRTISAAMLISILAAVTGCSDRKPDIDYDLIGGTYEAGENEYKVQIFSDSSDTTAEAPAESETESAPGSIPETTKSTTTKPAVTVSTNKAATPAQTVRTDLPKVTAEPKYPQLLLRPQSQSRSSRRKSKLMKTASRLTLKTEINSRTAPDRNICTTVFLNGGFPDTAET